MWGPADNINCGEWDVATTGFHNIRPYLHGLHLKDLHIIDGQQLRFEYCPIGDGDVDYLTVLRQLRDHNCDTVLSVATHFLPAKGSPEDAMRINYTNLLSLIQQTKE
jgi:sugar phosphate isomerase/epimerase